MTAPLGYGMASPAGRTGNKIPSGYKQGQLQNFTPQQMQLFQQMFGNVGPDSYLSKLAGGDENTFNQIEAPAFRQFNDVSAGIANRFSGMGTGGRHSSGFQNAQTAAGSNFAQDLQSQRQSLQRQAIQDLMGLSGDLLNQRPYEQFLVPKEQSQWGDIGGRFASAIPGALSGFALGGGPIGALAGGAAGFMGGGGRSTASQGSQFGVNGFMRGAY